MLSGKSIQVDGKYITLDELLDEVHGHMAKGNRSENLYSVEMVRALVLRIKEQESLGKHWMGANTYLIGTDRLSSSAISREFDKAIGIFDRKRLTEIVRGMGKAIADLRTNGHPCYKNEENGDRKYLFCGKYYTLSELPNVFKNRTGISDYSWKHGIDGHVDEFLNIIQELSFGPPPAPEDSFLATSPPAEVTANDQQSVGHVAAALIASRPKNTSED